MMQPLAGPNAPEALSNFRCGSCGFSAGMMLQPGPITACPECGAAIP
jgi:hypothetical protein